MWENIEFPCFLRIGWGKYTNPVDRRSADRRGWIVCRPQVQRANASFHDLDLLVVIIHDCPKLT